MKYTEHFQKVIFLIDNLLKQPGTKIVAIDGNAAAGKSTLASLISHRYDCNVFHMDDFFLTPGKRTEERLKQAGGNVDWERFREEVLDNIRRGDGFCYWRYDCKTQCFCPPTEVRPRKLNLVEGAYSLHPELSNYYDLKLFLSLDPVEQSRRILARNGTEMHKRFLEEWIPMENRYFEEFNIKENCDFSFPG
ncbi:MAG: uridine kinase family protein [Anaerovoracaceae bacterium]